MDQTITTRLVVFTYCLMLVFMTGVAAVGVYKWINTPTQIQTPTPLTPTPTETAAVAKT